MTPASLLDPQLAPLFVGGSNPSFTNETIPILRTAMAGSPITSDQLDVLEHHLSRADGTTLRLLLIRPLSATGLVPVVMHCHPGGWILGTPETSAPTLLDIACNLQCTIVSVDYRLAPEQPFPAAHEDMLAALRWVRSRAADLQVDAERMILAGESAGANIAAGVALRLRDDYDGKGIVGLSMVYSPLDDRMTTRLAHPFAGKIGLGPDHMQFAWASYLGNVDAGDVSPYAAPARAADFKRLPPVFLAVGALDPVVEENLEFAQRLMRDGVPATLHVFAGAPHGFDRLSSADVTTRLRELRNEHLKRCVHQ